MGCSSSKESRDAAVELQPRRQQHQITVSAPAGDPVLVPPPCRDQAGRPIQHTSFELDSETIKAALSDMAAFLDERGARVKLVTVGGAVNTLYLRSRQSTHDVDFFMKDATSSTHKLIHEAARFANRQRGGRLGAEWLNNASQLFMPAPLQSQLYEAAIDQGTVMFERGGLKVYAAPWAYALCGKLNRLSDENPRPYDLADAAVYLREHLATSGQQSVGAEKIRQWCNKFNKKLTDEVLQRLADHYYRSYGQHVIDWRR